MISSEKNPHFKRIKALLSATKARKKDRCFILETQRSIREALSRSPRKLRGLFFSTTSKEQAILSLIKEAKQQHCPCFELSEVLFKQCHHVKTSCGIIAIVEQPPIQPIDAKTLLTNAVFLDQINNPKNLGSIIRNAAAFSINSIILSPQCADPFHPEAIRASGSTILSISLLKSSFQKLCQLHPNLQFWIVDKSGKQTLENVQFPSQNLFIFGSEAGFSPNILDSKKPPKFDGLSIPISSTVDSLNVAAASSLVFYQHALSLKAKKG